MTITLTPEVGDAPARLIPGRRMDRDGFLEFCRDNPDIRAELLPDGTLELMLPMVWTSGQREDRVFGLLHAWWMTAGIGYVSGSTTMFALPDKSVRAPDAAWVSERRFASVPESELEHFPRLVPDFVIEVMSKTDRLRKAQDKMVEAWMANGVQLGWLIDPKSQQVLIYRAGAPEPEIVDGFDGPLSAGEVVPGFSLDLTLLR